MTLIDAVTRSIPVALAGKGEGLDDLRKMLSVRFNRRSAVAPADPGAPREER